MKVVDGADVVGVGKGAGALQGEGGDVAVMLWGAGGVGGGSGVGVAGRERPVGAGAGDSEGAVRAAYCTLLRLQSPRKLAISGSFFQPNFFAKSTGGVGLLAAVVGEDDVDEVIASAVGASPVAVGGDSGVLCVRQGRDKSAETRAGHRATGVTERYVAKDRDLARKSMNELGQVIFQFACSDQASLRSAGGERDRSSTDSFDTVGQIVVVD